MSRRTPPPPLLPLTLSPSPILLAVLFTSVLNLIEFMLLFSVPTIHFHLSRAILERGLAAATPGVLDPRHHQTWNRLLVKPKLLLLVHCQLFLKFEMLCGFFWLFSSGCLSSSGPVYGMGAIMDDQERGLGLDADIIVFVALVLLEEVIRVFHRMWMNMHGFEVFYMHTLTKDSCIAHIPQPASSLSWKWSCKSVKC